jgi:hypothetical protein
MSRGRSITTDLPMPSCTKRELESEPTTWTGPLDCAPTPGGSLASAPPAARQVSAAQARLRRAMDHVDISLILTKLISAWKPW